MTGLKEHYPLSHWDELPIHQSNEPIRFVASTDPRAFERYWFTAQNDDGGIYIVAGIGNYPNLGTTDAYAIIVHGGKQTTVRAHRAIGQDRSNLTIGPLSFELIAPFREWRLKLGRNDQELSFDLHWYDSKRAVFRRMLPPGAAFPGGFDFRLLHNWGGYETFGRIAGTVTYKDKTFTLDRDKTRGSRDHHWGTRDHVAGIDITRMKPFSHDGKQYGFSHLGQWVEFKDWSIWGDRILFNIGAPQPDALPVEQTEQKLRFDPVTKHLIGGVIVNRLPSGELREVVYEQIGRQCAYLRTGMYTGCNGKGTPDKNIHHGTNVGELVEGDTYDLTDPAVRMNIAGFEDHLVRATCNGETVIGILECQNPARIRDGQQGNPLFSSERVTE